MENPLQENLVGNSLGEILWEILPGKSCVKILVGKSYAGKSCQEILENLQEILHFYLRKILQILVGNPCGKLSRKI